MKISIPEKIVFCCTDCSRSFSIHVKHLEGKLEITCPFCSKRQDVYRSIETGIRRRIYQQVRDSIEGRIYDKQKMTGKL